MMETKKNPKLDVNRYSQLFFSFGLFLSMALVLVAFEWKVYEEKSEVDLSAYNSTFEELYDDVPITEQTPPVAPKKMDVQIIEVADDEEIEEEIEIDLDIEIVEETEIEEVIFEDVPEEEDVDEIFTVVEDMPVFPGGNVEFYKWVSDNLEYPSKALKAEVEGRVILRFVVDQTGDVSGVEVLKGIGFGCDEEALRVMNDSPNWIPGKQRGKAVKTSVVIPLNFSIN
jgi:protein TonB